MDQKLAGLLGRVTEFYRHALLNHPDARERLRRLGVADAAMGERFGVGFVDGTLHQIMASHSGIPEQLARLGLLDEHGHERFVGSIVVPVPDDQGNAVQAAFYAEDGALTWLFPETLQWWNAGCLKHSRVVTIVRDPLAGMRFAAKGEPGVIAAAGPGVPLGEGAREALRLHQPKVTIESADAAWARAMGDEIEKLGLSICGKDTERIVQQDENGFTIEFPRGLRFIVQGILRNSSRNLRASVKAFRASGNGRIHLDSFDLYHARSRQAFARTVACILGEDPILMEEHMAAIVTLAEKVCDTAKHEERAILLTEKERDEARTLLEDPKLLDRLLADLAVLGYVGEEPNKLLAFLAAVSRKLDDPLSVLVISRSGAGKSTLAELAAHLTPPEDLLRFTRLTAQSLYYQKPGALSHKLIVIEEFAGIDEAAYAVRVLQSAGRLTLSSAGGHGETLSREVKGPASIFMTTTRTSVDEETAGRFMVLTTDESEEQTERILEAQRRAETRFPADREELLWRYQNAQRMLKSMPVVNPFAPHLTFPHHRLSARRDHKKYLGLIRAVAFVHQLQRTIENGAIVADRRDIEIANRLADEAFGRSLDDLTPPSRQLLTTIRAWLKGRDETRFSQRQLRDHVGWRKTQLAEHVSELVQAEYLIRHIEPGSGRKVRYTLDWDGCGLDGERFLGGLTPAATLPDHFRPISADPTSEQAVGNHVIKPGRRPANMPEGGR